MRAGFVPLEGEASAGCKQVRVAMDEVADAAIKNGDLDGVRKALDKGASVKYRCNGGMAGEVFIHGTAAFSVSLLDRAAMYGDLDIVKLLVARGANPREVDSCGWGPAMWAVAEAHLDAATFLYDEGGADVNKRNDQGRNALMYAAWHDHVDVGIMLAQRGADPAIVNHPAESEESGMPLDETECVLADYGKWSFDHSVDPPRPSLTTDQVKQRINAINAARAEYLERLRRQECWERRKNALLFLTGSSLAGTDGSALRPLAATAAEIKAAQQASDKLAPIAPVDRSTPAANRMFLLGAVLGNDGLQRRIVMNI